MDPGRGALGGDDKKVAPLFEIDPLSWPLPFTPKKKRERGYPNAPPPPPLQQAMAPEIPEAKAPAIPEANADVRNVARKLNLDPEHFAAVESKESDTEFNLEAQVSALKHGSPSEVNHQHFVSKQSDSELNLEPQVKPGVNDEHSKQSPVSLKVEPGVSTKYKRSKSYPTALSLSPPLQPPIQSLSYDDFWDGSEFDTALDLKREINFFGPIGSRLPK